jgi:hypothetical protein
MSCKANCAACVKRNTPHAEPYWGLLMNYCVVTSTIHSIILLDIHSVGGIIMITIGMPILGDRGAREKRQQASEGPCPPRRGHAEPSTREGPRSEIPRQRVLRSPRHRAGQVRDAASRFCRECAGCQRNGRIRRIEADVLSNQGQFRRSGDRWARAEEAGTTRPPQTPRRSTGVYSNPSCCGQTHSSARTGEVSPAEIRPGRTPEDDRASGRRKKNSEMTSNAARGSQAPSSVVSQYETLRRAALGGVLPPEARWGLMLFLRRGMWGWIRAIAIGSGSVSQQPSCSPSSNWTASDEYRAIIHVFAALVLKADNQGARG